MKAPESGAHHDWVKATTFDELVIKIDGWCDGLFKWMDDMSRPPPVLGKVVGAVVALLVVAQPPLILRPQFSWQLKRYDRAAQARDNAPEPPSYRPAESTDARAHPPPPKTPRVQGAPPPSTPVDDNGDPISLVNPPYNQPAPVVNKPLPGRVAQDPGQAAAEKVQKDTMEKLCNTVLTLLRSGCPTCWTHGYTNWNTHFWNKCGEVCAGDNDEGWNVFKDTWDMPHGWCWGCRMPQKAAGGKHAFKALNQCDFRTS
ncbi:hypothetical protein C8R44DRAFT_954854 [Mycena epipterygia]|nr:hypothetical protein C8R44DRAFT_954854 [Mycena epipterygia]